MIRLPRQRYIVRVTCYYFLSNIIYWENWHVNEWNYCHWPWIVCHAASAIRGELESIGVGLFTSERLILLKIKFEQFNSLPVINLHWGCQSSFRFWSSSMCTRGVLTTRWTWRTKRENTKHLRRFWATNLLSSVGREMKKQKKESDAGGQSSFWVITNFSSTFH